MLKKILLVGLLFGSSLFVSANNNPLDAIASPKQIEKSGTSKGISIMPDQAGIRFKFQYVDDYGVTLPLRNIKVEYHDTLRGQDNLIDTVYTDKYGVASFLTRAFTLTGREGLTTPGYVKIFAENESFRVCPYEGKETYTWQSDTLRYPMDYINDYEYTFSVDDWTGRGFAVTQPMVVASDFGKYMNDGEPLEFCTVYYPSDAWDNSCYINNSIHLQKRINATYLLLSMPNLYEDYDVIGHEYGHHVQDCFKLKTYGGTHYAQTNIQDEMHDRLNFLGNHTYSPAIAREKGIHLAYSEGWATSYSNLAQKYSALYLRNNKFANDGKFTAYNSVKTNFVNYQVCMGEGSEESVGAFIYNLFDEYDANDPLDNICLPLSSFKTLSMNTSTFADFYMNLMDTDPDMDSILYMLRRLDMNPAQVSVPGTLYRNVSPVVYFSTGNGSIYYPNNDFDVYVEAYEDGIYESFYYNVKSNNPGSMMNFRIPLDDWERICELDPDTFTVYVVGWCDWYGIRSGGYESQKFEFEVPVEFKEIPNPITFVPTDWVFGRKYEEDYMDTVIEMDGHTFETVRLRTGCIDRDHLVLSAKNKNAGTAMFEITADCGFETVEYDISLWSDKENITSENSSIIVEVMDEKGQWFHEADLWNEITIPTDRNNMMRLTTRYDDLIRGIRWTVIAPQKGATNEGRVCIGNITFNF